MRSSRIASLALSLLAAVAGLGATGCGGLSDDDRAEIVRVVAAHTAAEADGNAEAYCRTLTRGHRAVYASRARGGGGGGTSADSARCAAGFRETERQLGAIAREAGTSASERATIRDLLQEQQDRRKRYRAGARRPGSYSFSEGDETTTVTLRGTAARDEEDGSVVVEREDDAWRVGYIPETATLR